MIVLTAATSSMISIISIIILIPFVIASLYKFTDKQLLERAGGLCIAVSATSLLVIVISLIIPAIEPPFNNEDDTQLSSLLLRLIFYAVGIGVGIIIYRSRNGVSVLSSIITIAAAAFSIVHFFIDSSLFSNLVALSLVCAAVAIIRQFRDKRNRSD